MSLLLKVVAAASLAVAGLWSVSTVPVTASDPVATASPPLPAPAVADTLSIDAVVGQLVGARADAPGLDALVLAGRVGRIDVLSGDMDALLVRVRRWQAASPLPVAVSAPTQVLAGAPAVPSLDALAAADDAPLAYLAGRATAEAAQPLGIQSPGPAVAIGASGISGPLAAAVVRGVREGRAWPSAALPDADALGGVDALAEAGLMEVRTSPSLVQRLRGQTSFVGLVVTDVGPTAAGAVEALRNGADVVVSGSPGAVFDSLRSAVRSGRLPEETAREAARRSLAAKAWAGLDLAPRDERLAERPSGGAVRISPWRAPSAGLVERSALLAAEVARRAVAVVQPERGPLPLAGPGPGDVFTVLLDPGADPDAGVPFVNALADGLAPDRTASYARLGLGQPDDDYNAALRAARDADVVVVAAIPEAGGQLAPRHRAFARALNDRRTVVLVALGDPGLAAGLQSAAFVAAPTADATSQVAAADAVTGRADVSGRLPQAVAGVAPAGAGVRYRQQRLRPGAPLAAGLDPGAADRVDAVMERAVASGAFPGGAVAVGRDGVLVRLRGYGRLTRGGGPATAETPYDLASLTKVVGTTTVVMQLVEENRLELDAPVSRYLPRYRSLGKEYVTVRQLLEHSAGHRAWYPFWSHGITSRREALDFVYADTLQYPPGTRSRYSDFDMIVLGEVIQAVEDAPLGEVFERRIYEPLGMSATGFRDVDVVDRLAAPTETDRAWRMRTPQGEVHDEAASVFGGVAGHAGLFSTAEDLARFGFVLANGGAGYGTRLFRRTTLERFTERVRMRSTYPTGLGWMVHHGETSAGSHFGPRSFGHTGFTGTSIWVDPDQNLFVVLLTNRVHPSRRNRQIRDVRPALADAVAGAVLAPPGHAELALGFGPVPADLLAAR
ncbi:serine hydrolase [Rubrivirga sp. IMCC45206]|uniref:serine hydrolase n=1 Tax=Rubrivirga sp. IMCC45206 TaxID=3391614 RepID=UPI00398FBBF3